MINLKLTISTRHFWRGVAYVTWKHVTFYAVSEWNIVASRDLFIVIIECEIMWKTVVMV